MNGRADGSQAVVGFMTVTRNVATTKYHSKGCLRPNSHLTGSKGYPELDVGNRDEVGAGVERRFEDELDPGRHRGVGREPDVPVGVDAVLVLPPDARKDIGDRLGPHAAERRLAPDAKGSEVRQSRDGRVSGEGRRDPAALRRIVGVVGEGDDAADLLLAVHL